MKRSLRTGVAYHGNRLIAHARNDMREIAKADMDIVVHMFSHIDWIRNKAAVKDMIAMTEDAGMEAWIDNWGLAGAPGDPSHFLADHPDSHLMFSNGTPVPRRVCLNSPDFRTFTKEWLDTVVQIGGKSILWDEPSLNLKETEEGRIYSCCCPRCKKLFAEKFNRPMPEYADADVDKFRADTITDYFRDVTATATALGLENIICIMPGTRHGISFETLGEICTLPTISNVGTDPYWFGKKDISPYEFVYNGTKTMLETSEKYGKDHNLWIQAYGAPRGREDEIIEATEAAYDAGARCILAWSYMAGSSNDYRSENAERSWDLTVEGMRRIRSMERDRILAENRKRYMK